MSEFSLIFFACNLTVNNVNKLSGIGTYTPACLIYVWNLIITELMTNIWWIKSRREETKRQWCYPYDTLENKQYNLLECDRI